MDWYIVTLNDLLAWYDEPYNYVTAICETTANSQARSAGAEQAVFTLQGGGMGFSAPEAAWRFEVRTPLAAVRSNGRNHFTTAHDAPSGQTEVRVYGGTVQVAPASGDPFSLNMGQQVIVDGEGASPVIDLAQTYLPLAASD